MSSKAKIIKTVMVSLIIFICLLFVALMINLVRTVQLNAKEERLLNKMADLNRQIQQNEIDITEKSTDDYIERYARDYLNMKGKDETVYKGKS